MVSGGKMAYTKELGRDTCRRIHEIGSITIAGTTIDRLEYNATNRRTTILTGRASADGSCYTDGYGSWDNVQAILKIILRNFEASRRTTRQIILLSGTHCDMATMYVIALMPTWKPTGQSFPTDSCRFNQYPL